ncbi:hypothetical protein N0V93_004525 [Gnomoniopsis smithogilvyi]|uniref:Trichothecene 3-O-acetyltransferase-like N-terminal domain-containing protein n=1 Tax=Gnomoniopsis smithogilvyi TaxID=1191159 RepID=A0A9W8YR85_9PEZI|nr:hypothetical protein N0V93_004525 [Gnomoniopsis smithogilvyi]
MTRSFIPFCLAFSTPSSATDESIINALKEALDRLADAFPYLAGHVVLEDSIPKIGILKGDTKSGIELVVRDRRQEAPSLAELREAKFPFSLLDGSLLTPPIISSWIAAEQPAPVIIFQASFVKGGLILGTFGNHTQMDCVGMGEITKMMAKIMSGTGLSEDELTLGNQARGHVIPLLGDEYQPSYGPGTELDDVYLKPTSFSTAAGFANIDMSSPPRWVYLNFSAENLGRLKDEAAREGLKSDTPFITTDDAICALLWQRINKARHARLGTYTSRLGRVVNVRKCFGLAGYLGNMGDTVEYVDDAESTGVDIWEKPLGAVASQLRAGLQPGQYNHAIKHHMQALATMLDRYKGGDKNKLGFGANIDFNKDLYVSSYTKVFQCCDWSFGPLLGSPEVGRRPQMANSALPGLLMFMPKSKNGDLAVAAALSEADIVTLRGDETLMSFAELLD